MKFPRLVALLIAGASLGAECFAQAQDAPPKEKISKEQVLKAIAEFEKDPLAGNPELEKANKELELTYTEVIAKYKKAGIDPMPPWFLVEEEEYVEAKRENLTAAVNEAYSKHQDYRQAEARALLDSMRRRIARLKEVLKMPAKGLEI